MNVLIRCDSSNIIGTGHVMRCLNMCEYFPENKYTFVCKNFNMNITEKILNSKHNLILLNYSIEPIINNYKSWIGCDEDNELNNLLEIVIKNKYDEIFIDHYGIDNNIEKQLINYCSKLTVISDIFDYNHYCSEFINYNSDDYEKIKSINLNPNTIIKCGIDNIIINKKFKQFQKTNIRNKIEKICVMLGGSDPNNYTIDILKQINNLVLKNNLLVYVIIGKSNNNIETINNFIKDVKNYKCLYDLSYDDLIKLYLDIDLCIGSLSITAYERLYMKVPQICLKIVENQNIQQLKEFNICSIDNLIDYIISRIN